MEIPSVMWMGISVGSLLMFCSKDLQNLFQSGDFFKIHMVA